MYNIKKNSPECTMENVKLYSVEKIALSSGEFFKLETKLIVEVNPEDPLSNDIRTALFLVKPELLRNSFKGYKASELANKNYDMIIEFKPITRQVKTQNGNNFLKTEWYPEIQNICFSGDNFAETLEESKVPDEVL